MLSIKMIGTQELQDAKKAVEKMKSALNYFKNESRKNSQIEIINVFIKLINEYEAAYDDSQVKEVCDVILLQKLKDWYDKTLCLGSEVGEASDIELMCHFLRTDLKMGKDFVVDQLALQISIDKIHSIEKIPLKRKCQDLREDKAMLLVLGDLEDHYKNEIQKFLTNCYTAISSGVIANK